MLATPITAAQHQHRRSTTRVSPQRPLSTCSRRRKREPGTNRRTRSRACSDCRIDPSDDFNRDGVSASDYFNLNVVVVRLRSPQFPEPAAVFLAKQFCVRPPHSTLALTASTRVLRSCTSISGRAVSESSARFHPLCPIGFLNSAIRLSCRYRR
jgi:hypothetical protein